MIIRCRNHIIPLLLMVSTILTSNTYGLDLMDSSHSRLGSLRGIQSDENHTIKNSNPEETCLTPSVTLGEFPAICEGTTAIELPYQSVSNSPIEYRIDFDQAAEDAGLSDTGWIPIPSSPIMINAASALPPGSYQGTIFVRSSPTCVSYGNAFWIDIYSHPTALLSGTNTTCKGAATSLTVELTGTPPWAISYTDGTTTTTIEDITANSYTWDVTAAQNTTYTLTAARDVNCEATEFTGTADITVQPQPTANISGSQTICAGSSLTVTGASAAHGAINWTHNGSGTLIDETSLAPTYISSPNDAGNSITLTLTVTSRNACAPQEATANLNIEVTDCIPQCPTIELCSFGEFEIKSVAEFQALGGRINFPCAVPDENIQLLTSSSDGATCPETITQTYEIWDECGNRSRCNAVIQINDTEAPVLSGIPADIPELLCTNAPEPPEIYTDITATDNCDNNVEITYEEFSTQKFDNSYESVVYTITRKWTATDRCGNSTYDTQTINVRCEYCANGIDDDGDGLIDENDPKCPCSAPSYKLDCNFNQLYYVPPVWQMSTDYGTNGNTYTNPSSLVISTPFGSADVNVRTADGTTFNQSYTITQGTAQEIPLTYDLVQTPNYNTVETDRGLIIESDQLIQVVYRITADNNKMMVTVKGEQALGQWFRVASQTNVCDNPNTDKQENHFISVMAVEDNTIVHFDFKVPMKGLGSTHEVTLDAGETYLVIDDDNNQSVTGSLVTANKTIAVTSGSQHSRQCNDSGRDGGADQLVPTCGLGTKYIVSRGQDNDDPSLANYAVIVGVTSNTQVFVNGNSTPVATLGPGEYYTYNMPAPDFSNHYIETSEPAYVYQFGSIQSNGEIGMAVAAPVDGCRGDRYIEFFKFPGAATNNTTFTIPDTGLSSLTLNGNHYSSYGISAQAIPGLNGWSTVTFGESDLENYNIVESDEYFSASQFVGDVAGGTMGYLTSFKDKIDIFHPETGEKTYEYFVGTLCGGQSFTHTINSSSCSGTRFISGFIGGGNTESYKIHPNGTTFEYTPVDGFTGEDNITVILADESGLSQPVCLSFYVCGEPPIITNCPEDLHLTASTGTCQVENIDLGELTAVGGCSPTDQLVITNDAPTQFPVGETVVTWTVTDSCFHEAVCYQTVTVTENEPPTFSPPAPQEECVESIFQAVYNPITGDISPARPEYYLFQAGDQTLDIFNIYDNCCTEQEMTIHWRIDFSPAPSLVPPHDLETKSSITGSGQPSTYGSDILFPGDGIDFDEISHTITYWLEDCNGIISDEKQTSITVTPRPNLIKQVDF